MLTPTEECLSSWLILNHATDSLSRDRVALTRRTGTTRDVEDSSQELLYHVGRSPVGSTQKSGRRSPPEDGHRATRQFHRIDAPR